MPRSVTTPTLEEFLRRLYATPGVRATRSHVVLSTYVERGFQAEDGLV